MLSALNLFLSSYAFFSSSFYSIVLPLAGHDSYPCFSTSGFSLPSISACSDWLIASKIVPRFSLQCWESEKIVSGMLPMGNHLRLWSTYFELEIIQYPIYIVVLNFLGIYAESFLVFNRCFGAACRFHHQAVNYQRVG
jgi:hypothetical protein